jgi:hypothetical protein
MDKKCREAEFENNDTPNKKAKRFPFWLVCSTCGRQGHKSKDCHSISYRGGEFIRTVDTYEDLDRIPRSSVDEIPSFENIEWRTFQKDELYEIPIDRSAVYEIAQKDESTEEIHVVYLGMSGCVRERMLDHHFGRRFSNTGIERLSNIRHHKRDAIAKGYTILYRYVEVNTRGAAKELETMILNEFNYAWNIDENGKEGRVVL